MWQYEVWILSGTRIVANLKRVAGQRKILISLTIVAQPEIIWSGLIRLRYFDQPEMLWSGWSALISFDQVFSGEIETCCLDENSKMVAWAVCHKPDPMPPAEKWEPWSKTGESIFNPDGNSEDDLAPRPSPGLSSRWSHRWSRFPSRVSPGWLHDGLILHPGIPHITHKGSTPYNQQCNTWLHNGLILHTGRYTSPSNVGDGQAAWVRVSLLSF